MFKFKYNWAQTMKSKCLIYQINALGGKPVSRKCSIYVEYKGEKGNTRQKVGTQ